MSRAAAAAGVLAALVLAGLLPEPGAAQEQVVSVKTRFEWRHIEDRGAYMRSGRITTDAGTMLRARLPRQCDMTRVERGSQVIYEFKSCRGQFFRLGTEFRFRVVARDRIDKQITYTVTRKTVRKRVRRLD